MLLARVSDIRDEVGFDDMPDINAVITESLHAATAQIESILDTNFTAGTKTDVFFVEEPSDIRNNGAVNLTYFRLSNGLIGSVTEGLYASSYANLIGGIDTTDLLAATTVIVKNDIGTILDAQTVYANHFAKFTYSYGFEIDTDDPSSYVIDSVPLWLQLAAKARAKYLVKDAPIVKEANIELDSNMLEIEFKNLIGKHLRYTPLAKIPL